MRISKAFSVKSLSAIARELGVSTATVSYVYNDKWRENRIHPDLAERVRRKLEEERGAPNPLGRQLQSGRTQTVGLLLPYLEQPYYLNLLAGIEQRLSESDYMVLLGVAHWQQQDRQVELAERMLARRVDALLMSPRPAQDLSQFLSSVIRNGDQPLLFVDNYLPECGAGRAVSDNRWGARQAVKKCLQEGRKRILFLGANSAVAVLQDRYLGYCDALDESSLGDADSLTVWRDGGDAAALETLRDLFGRRNRPDAILATSFFQFLPVVKLLEELGLTHPEDVLLVGFDEALESWPPDTVRNVIKEPLLVVRQAAAEMGRAVVDLALAGIDGRNSQGQERLIRPFLSWQPDE